MMTIKAGFVLDNSMTFTPEQERESVLMELEYFGLTDIEVVFSDYSMPINLDKEIDLLIIDYGGASASGAGGAATANIWDVCNYAEEHPSCFVAIWTTYTQRHYRDELEDEFGHVSNIFMRYDTENLFPSFTGDDEVKFTKKIQAWFAHDIKAGG